jgi:hypothetical protein
MLYCFALGTARVSQACYCPLNLDLQEAPRADAEEEGGGERGQVEGNAEVRQPDESLMLGITRRANTVLHASSR